MPTPKRLVCAATLVLAATTAGLVSTAQGAAATTTGTPPTLVRTIGGPGHAAVYPSGIEVAANGSIVISDIGNNQVKRYNPDGSLSWAVGTSGAGTNQFNNPRDVAVDGTGAIYVADTGNGRVVKLSAAGAWQTSFRGPKTDKISSPIGISAGDSLIYVADAAKNKVRIFDTNGNQVQTITSNGACQLTQLRDAAPDAAGDVYVANYKSNNIVEFDPSGNCVNTFGTAGAGTGQFKNPYGVTIAHDPVLQADAVYVADSNNERVQEFTLSGTFVAQMGVSGVNTPGTFTALRRVAVAKDGSGDVWGADPWGYQAERFARSASGYTYAQTIGGTPPPTTSSAVFNDPHGIGIDVSGNLTIADTTNQRLVQMSATGTLLGTCGSRGDGSGQFNWPRGVSIDQASGQAWIADTKQSDLQLVKPDCSTAGRFGTVGSGATNLNWPDSDAVRQTDRTVWVADTKNNRVKVYQAVGRALISTFGTLGSGTGQFNNPAGVSVDLANGHILVADTNNNRIVELSDTAGASIAVVNTYTDGFTKPEGVAADSAGRIYVTDTGNNRVVVLNPDGSELATMSGFNAPAAAAVDNHDNVFIADSGNDVVDEYTYGSHTGPGTPPTFLKNFVGPAVADMYPVDIAASSTDFYVVDPGRYRLVAVNRTTGAIDAVIGGVQGNGPGQFGAARAVSIDDNGNIYVADTPNNRIEKFAPDLTYLTQFGAKGSGPGQFSNQAYGVAAGLGKLADGTMGQVVYAVDGGGRVEKFDPNGTYISQFGAGDLHQPRQIDISPITHDVWVVNARDHQVVVYDLDGNKLFTFGSQGTGPGQFSDDPRGITINSSGTVYVSDAGNERVEAFDSTGTFLFSFGSSGAGPGQFTGVRGLVATSDGNITVTDEWDYSLKTFTQSGTFVSRWFGTPAPATGVDSPRGLRVDSGGRVFIDDWWNQRILRVNADQSGSFAWGQRGTTADPGALNFAWDVALQPGTNRIFVANRESDQIEAFTVDGAFVAQWSGLGTAPGLMQFPQGLAFAPDGTLLVADSGNSRIERFSIDANGNGTFLASYGTAGSWTSGAGFLNTPTGVSTTPDGTIWVADTGNNQVQKMAPNGTWTMYRTAGGAFRQPWGVTVAPDGYIWVADTGNNRIVKMAADGTLLFSQSGTDLGAGAFNAPHSIAFAPNGHIFVSDTWNNRVVELVP